MKLLLISNSTNAGEEYLRYPLRFMKKRPLFTREGRRIRRKPASQDTQKKGEGNH